MEKEDAVCRLWSWPRRKSTFRGAVGLILDSMPVPEARNVCQAYGSEAKAALRKVTRTNAEFKSEAQKEAMIAVAERRGDLAVVLGHGR